MSLLTVYQCTPLSFCFSPCKERFHSRRTYSRYVCENRLVAYLTGDSDLFTLRSKR